MSGKNILLIVLLLVGVVAVAVCVREPEAASVAADPEAVDDSLSVARTDHPQASAYNLEKVIIPSATPNEEIDYEGFSVGFNPDMHQPNYVAWTLSADRTDGPYSRKDASFMLDERVNGCATLADYRNSGFDRGHLAPAADMKWSRKAMQDCHLLTNMSPQDKRLNSGAWATVEKNARTWAQRHGRLVIVAGPVLSDRLTRSIGATPVPVPERFYKVIIAPDANPPLGIAFLMPNSYVEGGAQATVTSIDKVEAVTGFDFFSELPDDIEAQAESMESLRLWNK